MAPGNKTPEAARAPAKVETIGLKVFIHCEGCKKKVTKVLQQIDGVQAVNIDANLGKVVVTGTVDSKLLLKKLEKAGKVAEVLAAGPTSGVKAKDFQKDQAKDFQKDQSKAEKKENKKVRFQDADDDDKNHGRVSSAANGSAKGDINSGADKDSVVSAGDAMGEQNVKKNVGADTFGPAPSKTNIAPRNIAPRITETGYSMESADYATHLFSDENTESCRIM